MSSLSLAIVGSASPCPGGRRDPRGTCGLARSPALAGHVGQAAAQPAAPTYVSLNMCTDQLLLDLAQRSRIVGLSPFARDAARTSTAMSDGDIPILSGTLKRSC